MKMSDVESEISQWRESGKFEIIFIDCIFPNSASSTEQTILESRIICTHDADYSVYSGRISGSHFNLPSADIS